MKEENNIDEQEVNSKALDLIGAQEEFHMSGKKFSIQDGTSDDEFFTSSLPVISFDKITIKNFFLKGVIRKEVRGVMIEEFYYSPGQELEKEFNLKDGILFKQVTKEEIIWASNTIDMAEKAIKDKVILEYERVIPAIESKMIAIEQALQQQKQHQQNNGYNNPLMQL